MSAEELLTYIQQHELPEPLIEFVQNHNQKHLCLAGSQHCMYKKRITDEMLVDVASVISRVSQDNLIIDLGLNYLTDGCISTLKTLFGQKNIVGLSLRGNKLTSAAGDDLFELLHNSQLKYLNIAENELKKATEDVCRAIYLGSALHFGITSQNAQTTPQKLGTLQFLDLSSTGFTEGANVYLTKLLRSRFCGLRDLRLDTPSFNRDSHGINGFQRFSEAIKYNCTLHALTIRHCPQLDDESLCSIIDALDSSVATQNLFEELLNDLAKAGQQRVHERVGQMQKLQQRQLRAVGFPEPLQARAVTPLVYLDVSGCESLSFDSCIKIAEHLSKQEGCYLRTLILDGVKVKNKGVSALAEALVRYAPVKPQEDTSDATTPGPDMTYEVFGGLIIPETADGYGITYKNITKQQLMKTYTPDTQSIQLSLRRSQINGQGLCALALLAKLNKVVSYVAIQGNDLVVENGETANAEVIWHPAVEWELAFAVRDQTGVPVRCDFGLERAAQERGRLQFYKREPKLLSSTWVFE